ncbi:MAG TPA: N-acetyltransferase [Rhodospirillaceae bacterium]|nr:N-acetyltransferase [Rhodospirillaceae bacterium]
MLIRPEKETEFPAIYDLVKIAFQTAKMTNGDEQNFVDRLRASGNYIPDLALVAEEEGKLIGHVMLTKTCIETAGGQFSLLLLAPVSVVLERRNQGIGAQLIEESFRLAKALGHTAVIVVGDPAYYTRFGFSSCGHFNIGNADKIPDEYVMVCELIPSALKDISGTIPTFYV